MKAIKTSTFLSVLVMIFSVLTGCSDDDNGTVEHSLTITVSGKSLVLSNGQSFILRGINSAV